MSNSITMSRGRAATLTLLAGLVLPMVLHAQSLAQRIAQVRNGTVRLSFASRENVCGNGKDAIRLGDQIFVGSGTTVIMGRGSFGHSTECLPGAVRVTLTKSDGEIVGVKTAVSGSWRTSEGTDLGTVSAPEAARFFLTLAPMSEERSNKQAVLPAVLADSAVIWPELLRIAKTPSYSIRLRSRMLGWVGMTGDARAVTSLDSIAGDESSAPDLQSAAVSALANLPDEAGIPSVVRIAKGNGSLKARKQAVFWLGQSESVEGRRAVHEIVRRSDTPDEVRDNGIFALGQNGEPEDLRKLRALYPELPDKLREKMLFAVSQSGDPESLRWVISVALNGNESHAVRKHALFSAGQGGASMRELIGLWDKIEDRKLREQLLFVYSQREESEATDKLVSVAKSDPDKDLRKQAMFWLGQKDDERAAKLIREVLKQ